uniref:Aminotransferase-like plant mobile domain-containing protein n=1 Tax=Triticum urartu TaxID=4572 RepID=A0A8R7PY58_TRIUA
MIVMFHGHSHRVADNISTKDETIVLDGKSIPLNPEAVSLVLGIPAGGTKIRVLDEECGKAEFLSLFGLTELPSISFFGNKLMNEELPDDVYLRCFLTVALATFLCPTSSTKPSTKYLGALVDVSKSKDLDWCSFVHTWNISYVKKYQTDKMKQKRITTTLRGCIYQLAVRCLDFNNFGSITIPPALPRVCFWKGQTIKHFSDMLIGKDGLYGALEIKDEAETCYAETDGAWASTAKNSNIRKAIQRVLGNSFSDKIKEDIFLNFQERVKDQNLTTCLIAKQVLLDTLNIVSSSFNGSQHTEKLESKKLESSEHLYMPYREVRVDSNGIEIGSDRRGRKKRMKTSTQQSITSTSKDVLLQDKIKQSTPEVNTQGVKAELQPVPWNGLINEHKDQDEMEVNSEIGKGCTHTVGQSVRAECIALQQEAHKGESMNKVGPPKHNQDTNMLDGHSNILEHSVNACHIEIEAPEKSTSLNYMLLSARLAKAVMSTTQVNNSKEVSTRGVQPAFTGFQHNTVNNNKTQHCIDTSTMEQ